MLNNLSWSDFTQCLAGALLDEVAAHVVHEVNNPLAVISGTAEQLGKLLDSSSRTEAAIERTSDIILRDTARIRATTRALQDLAQEANSACYREARLGGGVKGEERTPKNPLTTYINTYIMNPSGTSLLDRHPS